MKKLVILALLALELAVCGCGNSNSSTTTTTTSASGNWEAQLTGGTGEAALLNFVSTFTVNNNGPLSITAFSFFNAGQCFVSGQTESGSATLTTDSTNHVTGTFNYTVQSGSPSGNTLTLNGSLTGTSTTGTSGSTPTLTGGAVAGTWTLTGGAGDPTCTGSGSFIMCQNATTCSIT